MSPAEDAGAPAAELFETIGQQAEQVTAPAADGDQAQDDDDQRVVEEIESLCMNCHDNVSNLSGEALA